MAAVIADDAEDHDDTMQFAEDNEQCDEVVAPIADGPLHNEDPLDDHDPTLLVSMVYSKGVLGLAFVEDTTLRFCQVADRGPEFRILQSFKYTERVSTIVCPLSSDQAWLSTLGTSSLHLPGAPRGASEVDDSIDLLEVDDTNADGLDAAGGDAAGRGAGPRVIMRRNRDFAAETAPKRLALLRSLTDLPDATMSETDCLIYLEHLVPREQEQANRAIAGLLAFVCSLGADGSGGPHVPPTIKAIKRFSLSAQLYLSPETFLSLGIFADDRHPSAHGGRSKEGFSVWTLMNRTKSKRVERDSLQPAPP